MTMSLGGTWHSTGVCLLLLAMLLGLAACGDSTTVQCPPRPTPTPSQPETWVQAPRLGKVTLALPTTVFGTDEHVQAAIFNHSQVIIETNPGFGNCAFFTAERLARFHWPASNSCRPMSENGEGGASAQLLPGTYKIDHLKIVLSPGTYRLKLTYALYPHNPEIIDGTVYSLPFQVCVCARCA